MIKTDQSLSRLRSFGEKKSAPRESKRRRLRARRFVVTNSSLFSFSNPRESLEDVLTAAAKRRKEKKKSRNRSPLSHSRRPKNRTLTSLLFFVFTSTNLCTVFFREKARIGSVAGRKRRAWILNATTRERDSTTARFSSLVTKKKKKQSTLRVTRTVHQLGHGQVLVAAELLQHVLDVLFVLTGDFHQRFDGREFCFSPHV